MILGRSVMTRTVRAGSVDAKGGESTRCLGLCTGLRRTGRDGDDDDRDISILVYICYYIDTFWACESVRSLRGANRAYRHDFWVEG